MAHLRAKLAPCLALLGVAMLTAASTARGDDPVAAAEALFQDGRRLMEQKKYAQACAKFAASEKLDPRSGTLLNLADCYEKNGQIASAWARFREAQTLAQRQNRPEREKIARERAELLEPKLPKLVIELAIQPVEVEIRRDGVVVDPGVLGTHVPVDPGKHTIEATARGRKPWQTTVDVSGTVNVKVPVLELKEEPVSAQPVPTPKQPEKEKEADKDEGGWSTQRTLGLVGIGVGVVGLGVGTVFGLSAKSKWSDAQGHCVNAECDADGVTLADDAKSAGNLSTVFFIAGGVIAAGGAVLFFTAPGSKTSVSARVTPNRVLLEGAF
jgi:hypothetical protein